MPAAIDVVTPSLVLLALGLSLWSSARWRSNITTTACKYRSPASPKRRAFKIWFLIYGATVASCVAQLTGDLPVLRWPTNLLWALAWVGCAAWTPLYTPAPTARLHASVIVLLLAAAAAAVAATVEHAWRTKRHRLTRILIAAPVSLLASWLVVAAALSWLTYASARSHPVGDAECSTGRLEDARLRQRRLYSRRIPRPPTSPVPLLLAVMVTTFAGLIPDPVLVLPAAWAVLNQRTFPSRINCVALLLLAAGAAVGVARSI